MEGEGASIPKRRPVQSMTSGDLRSTHMDLLIWLPFLFVLGLASMGLCGLFLLGCEKI